MEAFSLESVAAILAGRPDARTAMPTMPAIPSLNTIGLIENLLPGKTAAVSWTGIDEVITQAGAAIRSQILHGADEYIATRQGAERNEAHR